MCTDPTHKQTGTELVAFNISLQGHLHEQGRAAFTLRLAGQANKYCAVRSNLLASLDYKEKLG